MFISPWAYIDDICCARYIAKLWANAVSLILNFGNSSQVAGLLIYHIDTMCLSGAHCGSLERVPEVVA